MICTYEVNKVEKYLIFFRPRFVPRKGRIIRMENLGLYQDIAKRTDGDIYVGVVGPVRTGKSTFINAFAGKASAKTGNKPGVTKGKQWIKLGRNVEMLDTPGILWPKFDNQDVGMRLAMIGSINDNILNIEELAIDTINYIYKCYPDNIIERYELDRESVAASYDEGAINPDNSVALYIMEQIAIKRGCIKKGNAIDYEKASNILLDDFRSGRLGRITLERNEDNANS